MRAKREYTWITAPLRKGRPRDPKPCFRGGLRPKSFDRKGLAMTPIKFYFWYQDDVCYVNVGLTGVIRVISGDDLGLINYFEG
jgi:hypothetical protein